VIDLHIVAVEESLNKILNVERAVHPRAFEAALCVECNAGRMRRCALAIQRFFAAVCFSFFGVHSVVFRVHQIAQVFVVHSDCGTLCVYVHTLYADIFLSNTHCAHTHCDTHQAMASC